MTDELDRASEYEQIARDAAIERHRVRTTAALPTCEACEERPVHVDSRGTRWRFCPDCAEAHLRAKAA